jgi:hypothetical protein
MASRKNPDGRIIAGLFLIVIGVLFLLDQLGKLDFGSIVSRYWPLFLILIGLWQLVSNSFRNIAGPLLLILIGVILQLGKLEILGRIGWHYIWPLLIILLGLWILFGAISRRAGATAPGVREADLDALAIFSAMKRRVESPNFRGGKVTAIMGGVELDLTQASLAEGKATLDLSVIMGGIELRVPRNWRLEVDAHPLLGGIEDKHTFEAGTGISPTLHIKASAILGGIEIKD